MEKVATADYSDDEMHATLGVYIRNYASSIVTTNDVVDSISSLEILGISAVLILALFRLLRSVEAEIGKCTSTITQ
jgi:hypothetical protein